jgi:Tol biopolymer transport system component
LRNPYIVERPLNEQDFFIGRTAILDTIQSQLVEDERLFVLFGKSQIGKTSLLNQLGLRLGSSYDVRLLPWPGRGDASPLARLIELVAEAAGGPIPEPEAVRAALEAVAGTHGSPTATSPLLGALARRDDAPTLVCCIDAVDLFDLADTEAWQSALCALRAALTPALGIAVVLAVRARPAQVALALPHITCLVLERFTSRETEDLLMVPVRGDMTFDLDAVTQIHRLAGGEPHFVQLFGRVLFEQRLRRGWVDVPEVSHAADQVLALGAPQFEAHWQDSSWAARIVMSVFGERVGSDGVASALELGQYLQQLRIDMSTLHLDAALDELMNRDLIEMLGGRTYRFINTLFLRWIKREHGTLATVRASRVYHQRRLEPASGWGVRKIDWLSILLWCLAVALAMGVFYVWRSREREVVWTARPTPSAREAGAERTTPALPTPERGVAPGRIVYMAKAAPDDNWAIFVMRSDGSDPTQLTERGANDTSPLWSPDGRQLLFVSDRDGNREVYVMSADGSSQLNLTRDAAEDWTPCWSPDGERIAFASYRDGNWEIYAMDADGANVRRLTRSPAADYAPAWSPDGERIAFVSDRSGNLDIWTMAVDGSDLRRFTDDAATDQSPAWSPDGTMLAWESYRDGNMEIYAADIDGSELRNLSQDVYADDHGVTWSPWGDGIAYYTNRFKGWDIMTLDLKTGQRANITQSDDLEQAPHWGP